MTPDLPADLRAHSNFLRRIYRKFDGVLAKGRIEEWILQFRPEDRRSALKLALGMSYFSQADVTRMCKQLYTRLHTQRITKPCFVGFGNVGKSGSLIAYWFCKANELSTKAFVPFEDVGHRYDGHDAIVLVDDFLGTGDQAIAWLASIPKVSDAMPRFEYLTLVGYEDAKNRVANLAGVGVHLAHQLTKMDRAFSPGRVFDDFYEARRAQELFRSYGEELEPEWPLGYGNSESLVAFFYNTPNNTLPIFWSTNHNWIPLFERHESKHATTKNRASSGAVGTRKHLAAFADYLTKHEAVLESECSEGRAAFENLNSRQLAATITLSDQRLYSVPELGVSAAITNGITDVAEIGAFCNLDTNTVYSMLEANHDLFSLNRSSAHIRRKHWKLLVLDWSETLVDEYDLDEAICTGLCFSGQAGETDRNTVRLRELLTDLEQSQSHLWYDYLYLGKQFGKSAKDLVDLHKKNAHLMRPLCDIERLIGAIRQAGVKIALSTNCVARVLSTRLSLLAARPENLFDYVVTSDLTKSVRDKGANLDYLIERAGFPSSEIIVVGDSFVKDVLPAKLRGMGTVWLRRSSSPKNRSYWGTPELPVGSNVYEPARAEVRDRAADLMILDIGNLGRIFGLPALNEK